MRTILRGTAWTVAAAAGLAVAVALVWWLAQATYSQRVQAMLTLTLLAVVGHAYWAAGRTEEANDLLAQAVDDVSRLLDAAHRILADLPTPAPLEDRPDEPETEPMRAHRTDTAETSALMSVEAIIGRLRAEQQRR